MIAVAATEFAKRFARYRQAAQREPVAITHHNRVTEVLLSKHDYDEYMRLKNLSTRATAVAELSEDSIQALSEARMDSRHEPLDRLLEE
jgi:PHD/YefM family antitoxin component YafN of YafNO toxin-antitoxin module